MMLCERCVNGHVFRRATQGPESPPWVMCRVGYTRVPPDITLCNRFSPVGSGPEAHEHQRGYGGFLLDPRKGSPGGNYV